MLWWRGQRVLITRVCPAPARAALSNHTPHTRMSDRMESAIILKLYSRGVTEQRLQTDVTTGPALVPAPLPTLDRGTAASSPFFFSPSTSLAPLACITTTRQHRHQLHTIIVNTHTEAGAAAAAHPSAPALIMDGWQPFHRH